MSSYIRRTKNPRTGEFEDAEWIDDHFGRHQYGVSLSSSGQIYGTNDSRKWEFEDEAEPAQSKPPYNSCITCLRVRYGLFTLEEGEL
jgi:hypothetical protein